MSITANSPPIVGINNYTPDIRWLVNAISADFSGCEELKAAVAGQSHYITKLVITTASAIAVTIGEGETNSAVTTVLIGPLYFTTGGPGVVTLDFGDHPIQVTAATSITVDASGAGAACVVVSGFTL